MISNACKILGNQEHFVPELELLELTPVVFGSVPVPWSFGKSRELNLGFICKVLCSVFDNKPPARDPLSPKISKFAGNSSSIGLRPPQCQIWIISCAEGGYQIYLGDIQIFFFFSWALVPWELIPTRVGKEITGELRNAYGNWGICIKAISGPF